MSRTSLTVVPPMRECRGQALTDLYTRTVGREWQLEPERLSGLAALAEHEGFLRDFSAAKHEAKRRLAEAIARRGGRRVDPASLHDAHWRSVCAGERQLMHLLAVIGDYLRLSEEGVAATVARTVIVGGRPSAGDPLGAPVLALFAALAMAIDADARARAALRVVVLPVATAELAELVALAADVDQDLCSLPGVASAGAAGGRAAQAGAVSLGPSARVGEAHAFGFRSEVSDRPEPMLVRAVDAIASGRFGRFDGVYEAIISGADEHRVLADFGAYQAARTRASEAFGDACGWARMAVMNAAGHGAGGWRDRALHVMQRARDPWLGVLVRSA